MSGAGARNAPPHAPVFEPLTIRCPSAAVNIVIMVQVMAIGLTLDYLQRMWLAAGAPRLWGEPTHYQRWIGAYMLAPTWLATFAALFFTGLVDRRTNQEMQALRAPAGAGIALEPLPGMPNTETDLLVEAAANKSWMQKAVWFGFCFFLPGLKMSFDDEGLYSWMLCLMPFEFFFGYFAYIGIAHGNYLWTDQRDVNRLLAEAINPTTDDDDDSEDGRV